MKYKALITDFDNTLAGGEGVIDAAVETAIKHLIQQGIIISIATGRAYSGTIAETASRLGLRHALVTHNGAEIVDPVDGRVIKSAYLSDIQFRELDHFFKKEGLMMLLSMNGRYYGEYALEIPFGSSSKRVFPFSEIQLTDIPQVLIPARYCKMNLERAAYIEQKLFKRFPDLHIIKLKGGEYYGFDITSLKATKHIGVLEVLTLTRLKKVEVVGVGDNYNDYPLLMACGVKVAMGDAPEELKAVADFVAPAQQNGGFLSVIQRYFSS